MVLGRAPAGTSAAADAGALGAREPRPKRHGAELTTLLDGLDLVTFTGTGVATDQAPGGALRASLCARSL